MIRTPRRGGYPFKENVPAWTCLPLGISSMVA
jgi:hypothetical protein